MNNPRFRIIRENKPATVIKPIEGKDTVELVFTEDENEYKDGIYLFDISNWQDHYVLTMPELILIFKKIVEEMKSKNAKILYNHPVNEAIEKIMYRIGGKVEQNMRVYNRTLPDGSMKVIPMMSVTLDQIENFLSKYI